MTDLEKLTDEELKEHKYYLIGKIKELQKRTREIDKEIKRRIEKC